MGSEDTLEQHDSELTECRRLLNEWQALASIWRNRAQALEDQLATIEANRLIAEEQPDAVL